MKTTITQSEKMQLLGLVTLARSHNKIIDLANNEMSRIIEAEDNYSLLTDIVYDEDVDFDETLKNMEIEVVENATT
jgi:hypothetical protein